MNERKIIIGLITSKKYLAEIESIWEGVYIESSAAKRIATWCWEHYNLHENAIGKDIGDKYFDELKKGKIPKDIAEEIEEDILPSLSKESKKKTIRVGTLLKQTKQHFAKRKVEILKQTVDSLVNKGEIAEAEQEIANYTPIPSGENDILNFSNEDEIVEGIRKAHKTQEENIIKFPKQIGKFFNESFVKGGFVAFLGMTKVGKSWTLLDIAIRALRQHRKVAFFQAGDMTESEQLMRFSINIAGKSNKEKYCEEHWETVRDCVYNQTGNGCNHTKDKTYNEYGLFDLEDIDDIRKKKKDELIEAIKNNPEYKPCSYCKYYDDGRKGTPFIVKRKKVNPLTVKENIEIYKKFKKKYGAFLMLDTKPNNSLTVKMAKAQLQKWEKEGFVPDVILFDYADIMDSPIKEERHKQNAIWKDLRALSFLPSLPLVVTVTQADAKSYETDLLKMSNFSEDRRKFDHVTAIWGLNRDKEGREEELGVLRINTLFVRGSEKIAQPLTVLQNLKRGRPFNQSYF